MKLDINEQINQLPNSELVREVFDLIQSGVLLHGDAASAATAVEEGVATLVDSYDVAEEMAHSQEVLFRYFMSGEGGSFIDVCWENILEDETSHVWGALWDAGLMDTFNTVVPLEGPNNFFKLFKKYVEDEEYHWIVEDLEGAMRDCIGARMGSGRDNAFYERIFRVYQ
ncbi:MAG: hypothetical protein V4671_10815, partial [Armatimonadota bacterium]